ncbi:MAG: hypothetical protein AABY10_05275, partial [Nanoarchaeota archaeon]
DFIKILRKHSKKYKFVVVCGGGSLARKYISILEKEGKSKKELSLAGIMATRTNAQFIMKVFGKEANGKLPLDMEEVKHNLWKNKVVVCGALRYAEKSTSDGTAAKLAKFLKGEFINITKTDGLYSSNPEINKNAKFIPYIPWKDFEKRALRIKFKAGQHFVLDQSASEIIRKYKIKTYIIGRDMKNLDGILRGENFKGTVIEG